MRKLLVTLGALMAATASADNSLLVQSTTSTANSGLYDYLLPVFENKFQSKINVVAVGTGQAIRNASNCDADVLLVHAKSAEQQFVKQGYGVSRHDVMYNDFVVVGPNDDPANINESVDITDALTKIASGAFIFASRGDDSGTHKKEKGLWQIAGINPQPHSGSWYRETGSGMGATLNITVGMNAYTVTDRATWISFKNKRKHTILLEGDQRLHNQYGIILVSKSRCPNVNSSLGQQFIDWLTGAEGQALIASYTLHDQQLFYPNAKPIQ